MILQSRRLAALGAILLLTACSSGDNNTPAGNTPPPNTQTPPSFVNGVLQAYVKPSNTMLFPDVLSFGQAVALDGNTLAVGVADPSCATGVNSNQTDTTCYRSG